MSRWDDFELSSKAFGLMSAADRMEVLIRFSRLRYTSIIDRFFEAVHQVIRDREESQGHTKDFSK